MAVPGRRELVPTSSMATAWVGAHPSTNPRLRHSPGSTPEAAAQPSGVRAARFGHDNETVHGRMGSGSGSVTGLTHTRPHTDAEHIWAHECMIDPSGLGFRSPLARAQVEVRLAGMFGAHPGSGIKMQITSSFTSRTDGEESFQESTPEITK